VGHFALLDPDPDPDYEYEYGCGSRSTDLIESGSEKLVPGFINIPFANFFINKTAP
jgi:hypothetical protein